MFNLIAMTMVLFLTPTTVVPANTNQPVVSVESNPRVFCNGNSYSLKFNDESGNSNTAVREHGSVKVYREIAGPELDWAIYDSYIFQSTSGVRTQFSRIIIYAGTPMFYTRIDDGNLPPKDNIKSLPEGFYVPDQHIITTLSEFCALS